MGTADAVVSAAAKGGRGAVTRAVALIRFETLVMYTVQISAGYLLMLISMTYHAVLFVGVVLGLVLGHAAFNITAPVASGGASACCQHVATLPGGGGGGGGRERRSGDGDDADANSSTELIGGCCAAAVAAGEPKSCCQEGGSVVVIGNGNNV